MLAGGTVASASGVAVRQAGTRGPDPRRRPGSRPPRAGAGSRPTRPIPADPALVGRTLLIRHGDGTTHGWTLARVEPAADQRVRLHVREEPGFLIEGSDRPARYYQFPGHRPAPARTPSRIATIRR